MTRKHNGKPRGGGKIDGPLADQRRWRLLYMLQGKRFGLSPRQLLDLEEENERTPFVRSRPTLYRDLGVLEYSGFVEKELRNGEKFYRVKTGVSIPPTPPTSGQTLAMRIARRLLAPLHGTRILRELDALLPRSDAHADAAPPVVFPPPQQFGESTLIRLVERAVDNKKRFTFLYAPKSGEPAQRTVDPLCILVRDEHLYLAAFDLDREDTRTFKLARMSDAEVLKENAASHEYDQEKLFAHAAKVWSGPLVEVVIRIAPSVARFASEWPLIPAQEIEPLPDGAILVRAEVHGIVETMRWVLRWGKEAQVISPPELRAAVVSELLGAIQAYAAAPISQR